MIGALLAMAASCGPRALRQAARAQGRDLGMPFLRRASGTNWRGTTLAGLARGARASGFEPVMARANFLGALENGAPFIAHFRKGHFALVEAIDSAGVRLAGPAGVFLSRRAFEQRWSGVMLALRTNLAEGG